MRNFLRQAAIAILNLVGTETKRSRLKYRAPKNRNGSRARYFHAYLVRRAWPRIQLETEARLFRFWC